MKKKTEAVEEYGHATKLLIGKDGFLLKLEKFIAQIDDLMNLSRYDDEFDLWKKHVGALLRHAFGERVKQVSDFEGISYLNFFLAANSRNYNERSDYLSGLGVAKRLLRSIYDEVSEYFPDDKVGKNEVKDEGMLYDRKAFIVHGHDTELLLRVKTFLGKIDFEPIVLRDEPNKGRTIIEKFEQNAKVGFAVVLLTADDVGYDKGCPENKKPRARQNVVIELGYFIGRYGRERVIVLCDPTVERPGDIDGLIYIDCTNEPKWKTEIVKELRAANYKLDAQKVMEALL